MKLLSSALAFACLVVASSSAAAPASKPTFDTSGKCILPSFATPGRQTVCGKRGTISKPAGAKSYPAFSFQECASRCYATKPPCLFFGIINPAKNSNTPGKCTTYTRTGRSMGFQKSKTSSEIFYAAKCFKSSAIDDTPVRDGGFSASSFAASDPWSESGSVFTHSNDDGNFVGTINTAASSDNGEPYGHLGQTVKTCPGETYQLTYENADGYSGPFGRFEVIASGFSLRTVTKTVGDGLTEQPPLYFTAAGSSIVLQFYTNDEYAGQSSAMLLEVVDNVKLRAVYRGSLKPGTVVPDV